MRIVSPNGPANSKDLLISAAPSMVQNINVANLYVDIRSMQSCLITYPACR